MSLFFTISIIFFFLLRHRFLWYSRSLNIYKKGEVSFIAHRGCTDSAPENTVASFMAAVEKGFKSIEMDICTLKDGSLICSHNFDLEKETNGTGLVNQKRFEEIKNFDTGVYTHPNNKQKIPLLKDVIKVIPKNILLNIEIKCLTKFDFSTVKSLIKFYKKNLNEHKVVVSCFNPLVVLYIRIFTPEIKIAFLAETDRMADLAVWFHPDYLHLEASLISKKRILYFNKYGIEVVAWTVNNLPAIDWCKNLGIEAIITDNSKVIEYYNE